jgi:hypothetical protein
MPMGVDAVFCKATQGNRLSTSRMNRPTFADPKTDFVFKRIFGSEQHKEVLVAFLNDMLGLDEVHRIVRVELLSPEQRPAVAELKLSIVDVKCTDARGVMRRRPAAGPRRRPAAGHRGALRRPGDRAHRAAAMGAGEPRRRRAGDAAGTARPAQESWA